MPRSSKCSTVRLMASESGVTGLEYALIAAVISGTLVTAFPVFGTSVRNVFMSVPAALNTGGSVSSGGSLPGTGTSSPGTTSSPGGTPASSRNSPGGDGSRSGGD